MTTDTLEARKQRLTEVIRQHGEWTAMAIHLGDGEYTLASPRPDERLRRIVQLAQDLGSKPLEECRVLDLACLEGHYALELAQHGAEAVGIEGRDDNLAKCEFAREALGLERLSFVKDDVRNLSRAKYGQFDIVICSGILYHLDAPDVFRFVEQIGDVCSDLAIVDTFVSLTDEVSHEFEGQIYWGRNYVELQPESSQADHEADLWASIGNTKSFWITRPSLYRLMEKAGFTSILECHVPTMPGMFVDRITLVGIKGKPAVAKSSPVTDAAPRRVLSEREPQTVHPSQQRWRRFKDSLKQWVPAPAWNSIRAVKRTLTRRKGSEPWNWDVPFKSRKAK